MRHQKHGRKFGRTSAHRHAMFSNMVASLITHERIETTDAKAKEVRRIAEKAITWSVSLGDLLTRDADKLDAEDKARKLHAVRMAGRASPGRQVKVARFSAITRCQSGTGKSATMPCSSCCRRRARSSCARSWCGPDALITTAMSPA